MLGGLTQEFQSPPPRKSVPRYGYTSKTERHYHKFYASFTDQVLDCVKNDAYNNRLGLRGVKNKDSGIYFEFDDDNYLSVHPDKGITHKFHINQNGRVLELSISYDENGDLKIIKKYNDENFWNNVDGRFKKLLDIIEDCVNNFKVGSIELKLSFDKTEVSKSKKRPSSGEQAGRPIKIKVIDKKLQE